MREILFRGKGVDNGEWVYGNLIEDKWGDDNGNTVYAILQDRAAPEIAELWTPVRVAPETVGQYTGLTDKNGKKIFEGDIVRNNKYGEDNDTYDYYVTIFSEGSFRAQYLDNLEYTPKIYDIYFEGYEVIGNIYDNPELLIKRRM